MCKRVKGSLTLEGSFIIPLVLLIFNIIISISFSLFSRCYEDQKQIIKFFKNMRYTYIGDDYCEVIFEKVDNSTWINPIYYSEEMEHEN